jgi:type VI secretion system secreted protein VgrG
VHTPLGKDKLLLVGFTGREAISELFSFSLDMLAENKTEVAFEKLLGQMLTVKLGLPDEKERYFHGICCRIAQGERDNDFTRYRAEVVPHFWLLTKRSQSRIFQHVSVPEILKKVLEGIDVSFEIQGNFHPRDYCVQYRETDFDFAARLMEEEGIYYFFKHAADGHQMVVANTPQSHPDMPGGSEIIYEEIEGGTREEERIYAWTKQQELRSGKFTLWDHCFELPGKHLEAEDVIQESVAAGKVRHKLKVGGNDILEIYDYPGEYAQRFDGVDRSGGDRSVDLQKIFEDNKRTVDIRMQEESVPSLIIRGASNCRHLVAGHKFTLLRHFDADGEYLLKGQEITARLSSADYRSGQGEFTYENTFTCQPFSLPFRPPRRTRRPVVQGAQTAIVVGPSGEEIFTDKYGRVKVQFHWDREGQFNADSSCWVRVGTVWAGKQWGVIHIPRIGQEVIVDFLEGDPDQPIITGSVYNAEQMPPHKLPDNKTKSGIKSMSSKGGGGFNEMYFDDTKGNERVFMHAERDLDIRVKLDRREIIKRDRHLVVERDKREQVNRDKQVVVKRDKVEEIKRDRHLKIEGKAAIKISSSNSLQVMGNVIEEVGGNHSEKVTGSYYVKAMNVVIEAAVGLTIKVGSSFITINPGGIQIVGMPAVMINSGGAPIPGMPGMLVTPVAAAVAEEAANDTPGSLAEPYRQQRAQIDPLKALMLDAPTHDPNSEENKDSEHWIAAKLVNESDGSPVAGELCRVTLPDGTTIDEGVTNDEGVFRTSKFREGGTCKITFPNLDADAWK